MRNLKKILALVLALVMSLSLMATANAGSFSDVADGNTYKTAIEVLDGLKVFQGYEDGSFKPENNLNRAQAAVLVYRIATGDAEDQYVANYTDMAQTKFTDLDGYNWARGYINYCQNAEIIKGKTPSTFDPGADVTGYQLMAMILRAMGYGKNGEFEGAGWELQTATIAERIGVVDGIAGGDGNFGEPASRALTAQILFNAMLTSMVDYTMLNGYTENGNTLGKKNLGLEEIEGVVMANEFADLNSEKVLAEGKTQIQVEGEDKVRTLDISSTLEDIGERRLVYTQNTSRVLCLSDTDEHGNELNTTKENNGAATDISTPAKFQTEAGMSAASDIEYYVNFDRVGTYTCDQRLEFSVTFASATTMRSFEAYANGVDISEVAAQDNLDSTTDNNWTVSTRTLGDAATAWTTGTPAGKLNAAREDYVFDDTDYPVTFKKVIRADLTISQDDMDVLYGIFGAADNSTAGSTSWWWKDDVTGDVFVGTVSNDPTTREEQDLSNKISYNTFVADYINDVTYDTSWVASVNGEWVKFIDNDNDGRCDYAFRTWSVLDEVMDSYTKDGDTVLVYYGFNDSDDDVRYLDGTPALGDKVVWAEIDNQILVEHANNETVKVSSYSWRDDEITTDKGVYGQSGIFNNTDLQEQIDTMDEKVEYIVYFDHFGYVRAYELATKPQYALVTEIYGNNVSNGNLVNTNSLTIELSIPDSDTSVNKAEYVWANPNSNDLRALATWTTVRSTVGAFEYYNYLQPAISHLGVTRTGFGPVRYIPTFGAGTYTVWNLALQNVKEISSLVNPSNPANVSTEFDYGSYTASNGVTSNVTTSFTNIGIASVENGQATVNGAAQLKLNKDGSIAVWNDQNSNGVYDPNVPGERARYAVDYVQLSTNDIVADSVRYAIGGTSTYIAENNTYVNAVDSTEYYIRYNGGVQYFKGFANFPGLNNKDNKIHAAYAVARDTSADNANNPYWVADVIVYEVETLDNLALNSVALAYYTPSRTSGSVQQINTINSKHGLVQLTPGGFGWDAQNGQWGASYSGYGFYALYNETEPVDSVMSAASIKRIQNTVREDGNYGKNNIHAGIVTRVETLSTGGAYIDLATNYVNWNTTTVSLAATDQIYSVTTDQALTDDWYGYNEAGLLRWSNIGSDRVKVGDLVIWVGEYKTGTNTVKSAANFVVDLGNTLNAADPDSNLALYNATPRFLTRGNQGSITLIGTGSDYGEWQNIMDEQAYDAPTTGHKVTVKYTSADPNFPAMADKTIANVLAGSDYTVYNTSSALAVQGFTVSSMTSNPSAGTYDGMTVKENGSNVAYEKINRDVTVTVTYTAVKYDVNLTSGTGVTITATERNSSNSAATANTATATGSTATLGNVTPGNWVELNVSAALVGGQELRTTVVETVSGKSVDVTTANGVSYFKMPTAAVTVTSTIVGNAYTITVAGDNLSTTTGTIASNWAAATQTVAITADAGYEITGVVVTETGTGSSVTLDASTTAGFGNGTAIAANTTTGDVVFSMNTDKNVTITVTTAPIEYTLTFDTSAWTTGQVWYSLNGGDEELVRNTTSLTVTISDTISLRISGDNTKAPTVGFTTASNGDASTIGPFPSTGVNTFEWTGPISGIYTTSGTAPVIEVK